MMRLITPTSLLLALALAGACSKPPEPDATAPVATVSVVQIRSGNLDIAVQGFGTLAFDPVSQTVVTTDAEARVTEILVRTGQSVQSGTELLKLAPTSATGLDLSRARTDLAAARDELERQTRLQNDGLASAADVEAARLSWTDLQAQVDTLTRNSATLRNVQSRSGGIVDNVLVSEGDVVAAGTPLVRLAQPDAILAQLNFELEDATRLTVGDIVHLEGLEGGSHAADLTISTIDLRIDQRTRMSTVIAQLPPGLGFLPGEAVRANAIAESLSGVVLAPRDAIFTDEQGDYVYVSVRGAAERRAIEIGASDRNWVQINAGLQPGEDVVTEGGAILTEGMTLRVNTRAGAAE